MSPMPGCGSQLRYIMMDGPLKLRDSATKTDIHCILFTDMLLFTKPSKRDKLKVIKPPIRLDSLSIHEMKENSEFSYTMPIVTRTASSYVSKRRCH